jgi:snurportin-1
MVVLEYRMDSTVATSDDPPIVLGKLPDAFVVQMGEKLRVGAPLRFSIRGEGIQVSGAAASAPAMY